MVGEIIKKAGLKVTPQRVMVYELMTELGHSSIDEIISGVRQKNPEITVSTIYRILDAFCENGLILRIEHPNGKPYFDITLTEHSHVFINGEVIDYADPELMEVVKKHLNGSNYLKHLEIEKISIQMIAKQRSKNVILTL
jgi:Fe2+ or Zn2+ uptake regulation protein